MKRFNLTMPKTVKMAIALSVVFAMLLVSPKLTAQGLMLTGYGDFEFSSDNVGSSDDAHLAFDDHHFNLIAIGQIAGNVFAAGEVEYEHAASEWGLEYGYIGYTGFKNLRIMAGKIIVPFGRFNRDLHPTWINKMIDRPLGFKEVMPQTYNDVGIWLSGVLPMQNGARITYDVFAVNGLMGPDSSGIRHMRGNFDDNGGLDANKALGGRVGLELAPQGFDIGASIYSGNYSDDPKQDLTLTMFGVDAAFRRNGFEVRAEMISADQEVSGGSLKKTGGYAQASYLIKKFEPVVRFSTRNMPGESKDNSRISFGFSYYISAASAVRLNYHVNSEKSGFDKDNDVIIGQFTTDF